ncbi:MAG TPA: PAS domain S-box protein, partial [Anaerolineales bacterium]|nr:PAS domain S-box protein [Anaerolineales bacterium]
MNKLHNLLKRQLRRFTNATKPSIDDQSDLLRAVNDAYWQFDEDRRMLEHSLELTSQELLARNAELTRINAELEERVKERTVELSSNEAHFRALFEYAPISIWEEDFSAVRNHFDDLRRTGVVDFRAYFDAHPEQVSECVARVKILDVNRATLEMYQAESKEQLLENLSKVLGPESLIPFKEELLALERGETSFESELINYTLQGEKLIVFLRLTVPPGYEQTWSKVFIGISDITERRQAEAALAVERDLLQALMDNIPDTIYFKDTASRFTRINKAQMKILGVSSADAAIGKTDLDFQDEELAQHFHEEEQRIVKTGQPLIDRLEFNPTPEGRPRWFSATKVPIKDEKGRITGIVGVSRDITEIKQAEEAIRRSEERFRLIAWATQDAVWDWDLNTNQIWWGAGLQKIFRYPSESLQTNPEWRRDRIHESDQAPVEHTIQKALSEGMDFWSKEYRFQRLDGTYANVMDRAYILRDDNGKPFRMIGAMMDITERKQNEETIRHQNEMLASLHQITLDLLKHRKIDQLLNALVEISASFLDTSFVEIMLAEDATLVVKAATKNQSGLIGKKMGRSEAVLSWRAFDKREPVVLQDYASWQRRQSAYDELPLHAAASFPILNDDQCLGVLGIARDQPGYEFTPDEIQFGHLFANLTALVINNVQLREALHEQSIHDPLTGLFNRRYMEEAFKQNLSR